MGSQLEIQEEPLEMDMLIGTSMFLEGLTIRHGGLVGVLEYSWDAVRT